jgi:hypothetical protein
VKNNRYFPRYFFLGLHPIAWFNLLVLGRSIRKMPKDVTSMEMQSIECGFFPGEGERGVHTWFNNVTLSEDALTISPTCAGLPLTSTSPLFTKLSASRLEHRPMDARCLLMLTPASALPSPLDDNSRIPFETTRRPDACHGILLANPAKLNAALLAAGENALAVRWPPAIPLCRLPQSNRFYYTEQYETRTSNNATRCHRTGRQTDGKSREKTISSPPVNSMELRPPGVAGGNF